MYTRKREISRERSREIERDREKEIKISGGKKKNKKKQKIKKTKIWKHTSQQNLKKMPFVLLKVPFQQKFLVVWLTTQFQLLTMHKIQMNLIHLEKKKKNKRKQKRKKKKKKEMKKEEKKKV